MNFEQNINASQFGIVGADATAEGQALSTCEKKLNDVRAKFPDWYELLEETFPDNAPRAEVVELLQSAPNDFAMGLMFGKFSMRLELEAVTGRAFE